MRRIAAVLAALLVVLVASPAMAPSARAAVGGPKVVIVVGATHSATSSYRSYGDEAAAAALKYTSNVVKVYSPNATWTAVKNALQGASVVLYLGHGNGVPSPYHATLPNPATSVDGFGLNAAAGQGDDNTQYWGEYYIARDIRLAPNAVVILSHLCYAAGNPEPGGAEPTLSVAHQRIDNFGAGFIKAGARAVIAETHGTPATWMDVLFTTRQTIDQAWRTFPRANGHAVTWGSGRSPGFTAYSDPITPTSGFYRSMVAAPSLMTTDVTGGAYVDTGADPSDFLVPGAASVDGAGVGLYPDASLGWHAAPAPSPTPTVETAAVASPGASPMPTPTPPPVQDPAPSSLAGGTKLRIEGEAPPAPDGSRVFKVVTLDGSKTGYAASADLVPRDSYAPWLRSAITGPYFSPNGDGVDDVFTLKGALSETIPWTIRIKDGSNRTIVSATGTSTTPAISWDGRDGAATAPDGTYTWQVTGSDAWGNAPLDTSGSFVLDAHLVTSPELTFVPIDPVRLLDTRVGNGLTGAFTNKVPRTVRIAGRGGIPTAAVAVTVNVTVVGQTIGGYVSLTPTPTAAPTTSTINFPAGDTRANGATIQLAPDGSLAAVFVGGGSTQLVIDVTGYFVAGTAGDPYVPIDPVRLLDTRVANGLAGPFVNGVPRTVVVAGRGGVPADAAAVTVNVTVVGQTSRGYVSLTPTPIAAPGTSTINFPAGDTRANGATVRLGPDGTLAAVFVGSGSTQLILDVTGYYLPTGASGHRFVPLTPVRVLDTRVGTGLAGGYTNGTPRTLQIGGRTAIPAYAAAVVVNVTVVGQTRSGYVSLTPTPTATPTTSTINFPVGDTRANGAMVTLAADGTLASVYRGTGTTQLVLDVTGYYTP